MTSAADHQSLIGADKRQASRLDGIGQWPPQGLLQEVGRRRCSGECTGLQGDNCKETLDYMAQGTSCEIGIHDWYAYPCIGMD